jgi:hypothetical protein
MIQPISPLCVTAVVVAPSTTIAPSTRLISDVISLPFSSTISAFSHVIGYLPALQFSGTVYLSVNTVEPSAAFLLSPLGVANARSDSPLSIVSASYAEPLATPA